MKTQEKLQKLYIELQGANINEFVSAKGGAVKLDYLSWGACIDFFTKACHQFGMDWTYSHRFIDMGSRGSMVETTITLLDTENCDTVEKTMSLPCMNHTNQAAKDADVMIINKTNMRSLVKCMTLFGLGLKLYLKDYSELDEVKTKTQLETSREEKEQRLVQDMKNRIKDYLSKIDPAVDTSMYANYETINDVETLKNIGIATKKLFETQGA